MVLFLIAGHEDQHQLQILNRKLQKEALPLQIRHETIRIFPNGVPTPRKQWKRLAQNGHEHQILEIRY